MGGTRERHAPTGRGCPPPIRESNPAVRSGLSIRPASRPLVLSCATCPGSEPSRRWSATRSRSASSAPASNTRHPGRGGGGTRLADAARVPRAGHARPKPATPDRRRTVGSDRGRTRRDRTRCRRRSTTHSTGCSRRRGPHDPDGLPLPFSLRSRPDAQAPRRIGVPTYGLLSPAQDRQRRRPAGPDARRRERVSVRPWLGIPGSVRRSHQFRR